MERFVRMPIMGMTIMPTFISAIISQNEYVFSGVSIVNTGRVIFGRPDRAFLLRAYGTWGSDCSQTYDTMAVITTMRVVRENER